MTCDKFEEARDQVGVVLDGLRFAEMDAVADDAEVGVGEAAAAVAELGKEAARLPLGGFELPGGGAEDDPRVTVEGAHPISGIALGPMLGDGVLGLEGELVLVAPGVQVEQGAD